jgi:superfamily II DNA/RNA helicase
MRYQKATFNLPTTSPSKSPTFGPMDNSQSISRVLEKLNIAALNEMQLASLEANKQEKDVVLLAPTGSGKTLGFLLPILNRLNPDETGVQALVLAPSRELAQQIEQVFRQMGTAYKVTCSYGGHPMKVEQNNLTEPPALLIGTPGRIADHLRRGSFDPASIRTLVLDEFDKALELGFQDDMESIINRLSGLQKRILTSATQALKIPAFTGLKQPINLNFLGDVIPAGLALKAVVANENDKLEALFRLICQIGSESALVFCNHREAVDRISGLLVGNGLIHEIYHGGMGQEDRERALIKLRNGSNRLLITTDLASRGLDIPQIRYVIHYQLPLTEEAFVHRNGRTARMMAEGTAYLVLAQEEALPPYLAEMPPVEELPGATVLPPKPEWATLYIGAGKKNKVNKMDVVGLVLQKGGLQKEELGLIEVRDFSSYAAVIREKANQVVGLLRQEKIKNQRVKIEVAR